MKLLITSVGSLLGQNILDSIESRRHLIDVVGIDAAAENPRNFRCDKVYLVPKSDSSDYEEAINSILEKEKPDFIIPGRDGDCVFLADLKSKFPMKFEKSIPFGNSFIPRVILDKFKCFLFCQENQLPFADTFLYKDISDREALGLFVDKHGFPLVVKPREGFGSHGVFYVLNNDHLEEIIKEGGVLFQEFLGDPKKVLEYKDIFKKGLPLFMQIPEETQYTSQVIIRPDGTFSEVFITINTMVFGRNEYIKRLFIKEVEDLTHNYIKSFYEHGWYGPLNIQLKPDKKGKWKVYELNSRHSGSTSTRLHLGFDEIGELTDSFIPEKGFPNLSKSSIVEGHVFKYLQDNLLLDKDTDFLNAHKVWKKNSH